MQGESSSSNAVRAATSSVQLSAGELSDRVTLAAAKSRRWNMKTIKSSSLAQLRLTNMKLHGREEDVKLFRCKLQELKKGVGKGKKVLPEIVLVSGVSG